MSDSVVIKAVMYWPFLNHKTDDGKYQVDLCHLSPKAVKALTDLGITVKNKEDDREDFITCYSQYPIRVKSAEDGEDMTHYSIGNGTTCIAGIGTYEWTYKGKSGVSPAIGEVKIVDLVEYSAGEVVEANEEAAL